MNSSSAIKADSEESLLSPTQLVEQLEMLTRRFDNGEAVDAQSFVAHVSELRKAIAPKGIVYATREQAAVQREIGQLLSSIGQNLRDFYYDPDAALLTKLLDNARRAVALSLEQEEYSSPPGQSYGKGSDELLGNILIVGWW